jgi:phthiodiolone/phenolphthiodiolone dimycocerosates ketoreductase
VPAHTVETAVTVDLSRHVPLAAFGEICRGLQSSGVVDYVHVSDQLMSWFPRDLWTPEETPMAAAIPDIDSFPDPFMMGAYGAAAAPDLGLSLTTDAIRRGAPEVTQSLLTLANMSNRRPILQMGAGEIKQTRPFGHKRSQGLARLEDQYRAFNLFWESDAPFDLDGNHTHFEGAWIGSQRGDRKPRFWGLGGGPKFFDLTTSHAHGLGTAVPLVWSTPEKAHAEIVRMKQELERKGRDPESFDFGIWCVAALHEDEAAIEEAMGNTLLRWIAAVFGRLNMGDWAEEGIDPPFPVDWHYAMKLLPMQWTAAQVHEITDPLPDALLNKSMFKGTPARVAAQLAEYAEAGATWIQIYDFMPIYLAPEEAATAHGRSIEVCRELKRLCTAPASSQPAAIA